MEAQQALTLSKTVPDAFLAIIKRMSHVERNALLSEFKAQFPKEYNAWLTPDTKSYLELINSLN